MSAFKDIQFSSMDSSDLGAAAAAVFTSSDDDDQAMLSLSDDDQTTPSLEAAAEVSTSEDGNSGDGDDEYGLGEFLWDALADGLDGHPATALVNDWVELCPA
jgi:hypothetical protein